ncbi:microtubule integrity protein mal3 [Xanthoria parietina]
MIRRFPKNMAKMDFSLLFTFFNILHLATAQQEAEEPESRPPSSFHRIVIIHATLMGLVFVLLLPLGVFLIRLLPSKHKVRYHASLQLLSAALALAAFGLGAWMATVSGAWTASNGHPILGTIIIALLFVQPVLGYVHHRLYIMHRKDGRTAWGVAHVWYGRLLIVLAVINGGLGLQLSDNTIKGEIAYGVVAGVMFLLYLAVLGVAYWRKGHQSRGEEDGGGGEK